MPPRTVHLLFLTLGMVVLFTLAMTVFSSAQERDHRLLEASALRKAIQQRTWLLKTAPQRDAPAPTDYFELDDRPHYHNLVHNVLRDEENERIEALTHENAALRSKIEKREERTTPSGTWYSSNTILTVFVDTTSNRVVIKKDASFTEGYAENNKIVFPEEKVSWNETHMIFNGTEWKRLGECKEAKELPFHLCTGGKAETTVFEDYKECKKSAKIVKLMQQKQRANASLYIVDSDAQLGICTWSMSEGGNISVFAYEGNISKSVLLQQSWGMNAEKFPLVKVVSKALLGTDQGGGTSLKMGEGDAVGTTLDHEVPTSQHVHYLRAERPEVLFGAQRTIERGGVDVIKLGSAAAVREVAWGLREAMPFLV